MAADIFEMLVDILKINQNLVYEYSNQGALYQLFYLFIFPTLFIVIFIWILSNRVMGQHKGLRLLLAVGVYAFIILQGYYSWFVTLSKYWLFGLIVLGFLYMIVYRGGNIMGGGGGAKGKVAEAGGGALHFVEEMTGMKINPAKVLQYRRRAERTLKLLAERKRVLEKRVDQVKKDPKAAEQVFMQLGEVDQAIVLLTKFISTGAWHDYEEWYKMNAQKFGI